MASELDPDQVGRLQRTASARTDIGIVGSGVSGRTLALILQRRGVGCTIHADRTAGSATPRTGTSAVGTSVSTPSG